MTTSIPSIFPGGSKSKVNKAGVNIRDKHPSFSDFQILDEWRAAHRAVLNTFQAILRNRTRNTKIVVAQRHKRKSTIVGKLSRYPSMNLARMDDVAGCRLIFPNLKSLSLFREKFHKARFKHKRLNEVDKYDYIKSPKPTGYRGIHDVYSYDVKSDSGRTLKGLLVEIQYRTLTQHAWATAVEVIGFITESQPKFQQGDNRYEYAMALASEILARSFEEAKGTFPEKEDQELVSEFFHVENQLGLLNTLRGLNAADLGVLANRNVILIFSESEELEIKTYRGATEALKALFILEKEKPDSDIVLVRADTTDEVRLAFRNYFSDAYDFIRLIDLGCNKLSGNESLFIPKKIKKVESP